jgi:hypothetical protein
MWEPRRLTTLWASTACYRDSIFITHLRLVLLELCLRFPTKIFNVLFSHAWYMPHRSHPLWYVHSNTISRTVCFCKVRGCIAAPWRCEARHRNVVEPLKCEFLAGCFAVLPGLHRDEWKDNWWIGEELDWNGRGLVALLFRYSSRRTEEDHGNFQSG